MYNRNKANTALAGAFILFTAANIMKFFFKDNFAVELLSFTFEAALIGGVADWFAVTALFRKPLGFSWHTALIPRNRAKLSGSISVMVEQELLASDLIMEKMESLKSTDLLSGILEHNDAGKQLGDLTADFIRTRIKSLDTDSLSGEIERYLKDSLKKLDLAALLKTWMESSVQKGNHRELLVYLVEKLRINAAHRRTNKRIYKFLKNWGKGDKGGKASLNTVLVQTFFTFTKNSDYTNIFAVSNLIQEELLLMLDELKNPEHPLFKKILKEFEGIFRELEGSNLADESLEAWKQGIIEQMRLKEVIAGLLESCTDSEKHVQHMAGWLSGQLIQYWQHLKDEKDTLVWMDKLLRSSANRIIKAEHHLVGETVKETLETFSDDSLINFIEDKVGDDLQWIRINGTLVGGIVGFLIFLFLHLVYSPYITPVIRHLFNAG